MHRLRDMVGALYLVTGKRRGRFKSPRGRQMDGAVAHYSHDAVGQQAAQDRGSCVRLSRMPANRESTKGSGLRASSICRSQIAKLKSSFSRGSPSPLKGSNGFTLLLRYVRVSPVGHMSTHQSFEEFPVVRTRR